MDGRQSRSNNRAIIRNNHDPPIVRKNGRTIVYGRNGRTPTIAGAEENADLLGDRHGETDTEKSRVRLSHFSEFRRNVSGGEAIKIFGRDTIGGARSLSPSGSIWSMRRFPVSPFNLSDFQVGRCRSLYHHSKHPVRKRQSEHSEIYRLRCMNPIGQSRAAQMFIALPHQWGGVGRRRVWRIRFRMGIRG